MIPIFLLVLLQSLLEIEANQNDVTTPCVWNTTFDIECNHIVVEDIKWDWESIPHLTTWVNFNGVEEFAFHIFPARRRNLTTKIKILNSQVADLDLSGFYVLLMLELRNTMVHSADDIKDFPKSLKEIHIVNGSLSKFELPFDHPATILDLAENRLAVVPVSERLQSLNLRGNRLVGLKPTICKRMTDLAVIDLSHNNISDIPEDAFECILPRAEDNPKITLTIDLSHNKIRSIHSRGFIGLNIGMIDLRNNALTTIDSSLLAWHELNTLNLEYNPWACECDNKWMLETLVPHMYINMPEQLFFFRCGTPKSRADKPLVYWLNHSSEVFCSNPTSDFFTSSIDATFELWSFTMIATVVLAVLIVILIIAILVTCLTPRCRRKQRIVRRPHDQYERLHHKHTEVDHILSVA